MWLNANRNRWPAQVRRSVSSPVPDSGRLVGVLGPVVEVLRAAMGRRQQKLAVSDLIAGQLVGHQHARHVAQTLEQLTENRVAATALRRDFTRMSSTLPCWSTARHR